MLLRFFLKIWPALVPILIYLFWVFVIERIILKKLLKKKNIIKGEKVVGEKTTDEEVQKISRFSLQNHHFLSVLYLSLILAILSLLYTAFSAPKKDPTSYVPAQYKDGKILPPKIQ